MANLMKLMKQAATMRQEMERVQAEIAEETVEFTSGGGAVKAVVCGDMTLKAITIDPQVVDPEDVDMLQDLVLAAVTGALKEARRISEDKMRAVTAGMGLPGMNFP